MSDERYRVRQELFAHVLWLGGMPPAVHLLFGFMFGAEAESSLVMLLASLFSAACVGAFLSKKGYGLVAATLGALWPLVPASLGHWHWNAGMPAPGASAQALARSFGWTGASMTAALSALAAAAGAAGWLFMLFDRWYKRKTGHSLFEES